jgi:PAS domain S-box-containing protein
MLAAREMQLRLVSDSVPALLVELDAGDRIRYCNSRYASFFGKASETLIGQTFASAVDQGAWDRYAEHRAALRAGRSATYERVVARPDKPEVKMHIQLVPRMERGEYAGCYLMAEDITERERLARMKEDFIRSVTHELRTPLQAIRASLDAIAAESKGRKVAGVVTSARASVERLVRLVNDILDYQRLRAGHRLPSGSERIELSATVREALAANESLAREAGAELRVQEAAMPIMLAADPDRVVQLTTNLVANALKHSAKGDAVEIRVERGETHARVSVRDHGPGVPADFQSQLFRQFAQGQAADGRKRAGTGLGLAICKALAEQMGGRVGFEPAADGGAVFWFELPL